VPAEEHTAARPPELSQASPAARSSAWTSFWRAVVRFQREKISPWLAFRNAIGVTLPIFLGVIVGRIPSGLVVATGALNVCFSDGHEPYLLRAKRMLAASVLVGLAVTTGSASGHDPVLAVAMAGAWAFCAGILVALSTAASDLGTISLVTLVVYAAVPQSPADAVLSGLLAFGGGLLQTGLAIAFWPFRRYVPERRALGDLYVALADAAESPVAATEAPPASDQSTAARNALASLSRDHSIEGERFNMLLAQAERMRLSLMALARMRVRLDRELPDTPEAAILERYFAICAHMLRSIGEALRRGSPAHKAPLDLQNLHPLPEQLRARVANAASPQMMAWSHDAVLQMDALTGQLRAAIDLTAYAAPAGLEAFQRREAHRPWRLRLAGTLVTLRANLSLRSAAFRHAIRLAVCVSLGDALARGFGLQRAYWLPMTIAIVLKPDFTATFSRGMLRLAGTFVGLVVATAIAHVLPPGPLISVGLIALTMFVVRWLGPANYGILVTGITALVVLLIGMTGVAPQPVVAARGWNTAVGGFIALLAYLVWPTWERTQVKEALAQMLDAYRAYFRAIRESYMQPETSFAAQLDHTRLAARLARSNLEASVDRVFAEPGTALETVRSLSSALASSHRMVHAMMALEAGLSASHPVPPRDAFRPFANDTELTMYYLAAGLRGSPDALHDLPNLREDHHALVHSGDSLTERYALVNVETDRLTNSLNTLSEVLRNWIVGPPQQST
jgi:uncharacterized membrane protein YccC